MAKVIPLLPVPPPPRRGWFSRLRERLDRLFYQWIRLPGRARRPSDGEDGGRNGQPGAGEDSVRRPKRDRPAK